MMQERNLKPHYEIQHQIRLFLVAATSGLSCRYVMGSKSAGGSGDEDIDDPFDGFKKSASQQRLIMENTTTTTPPA
jgi:hypothetical protein